MPNKKQNKKQKKSEKSPTTPPDTKSSKSSSKSSKANKTDAGDFEKKEKKEKLLVSDYRVSDVTVRALKKDNITSLFPIQVTRTHTRTHRHIHTHRHMCADHVRCVSMSDATDRALKKREKKGKKNKSEQDNVTCADYTIRLCVCAHV